MRQILCSLVLILFFACDSPLSDLAITDPSVIRANFSIKKTFTPDGVIFEEVSANLNDKHGSSIELKEGEVLVNDQKMAYKGRIQNYESNILVESDTPYLFDVVLADGQSYKTEIKTPSNFFGTVNVPIKISINDDLVLSWSDFNPDRDIKVTYISYRNDGTWVTHYNQSVKDLGSITVKKESMDYRYFNVADVVKSEVRLTRTVNKNSNQAFRAGSVGVDFLYVESIKLVE